VKIEVRNAHVQLIQRNVELSLVGVARQRIMKCPSIRMSRAFEQAALDSMLSQIRRVTHPFHVSNLNQLMIVKNRFNPLLVCFLPLAFPILFFQLFLL